MKTLITGAALGLAATLAVAAQPPAKPTPADQQTAIALEGAYTVASGERDGRAMPEAELKGLLVRFADGKVIGTDKDRIEFFAATYTVDASKKPWKIEMKPIVPENDDALPPKMPTTTGLIKKESETLTLIYALPGGDAPSEFKTKDKQQMFVLKNMAALPTEPNKFQKGP